MQKPSAPTFGDPGAAVRAVTQERTGSLLARAKELSSVLAKTHPASQQPKHRTHDVAESARRHTVLSQLNHTLKKPEETGMDMLLARAKELSSVLSKELPPSQRPAHTTHDVAESARRRTTLTQLNHTLKKPEEIGMASLLARAKELSSVLAKTHPASQRPAHTTHDLMESLADARKRVALTQLNHTLKKPEETGMNTLLARAKELSSVLAGTHPASQRPAHTTHGVVDSARRRTALPQLSHAPKSPQETGMDTLLARAKELSSVLAKTHPASQQPKHLAQTHDEMESARRRTTLTQLNNTFKRPEETGMDMLLARAKELSSVLATPEHIAHRARKATNRTHAASPKRNQTQAASPGRPEETGMDMLLARAKELSSVLSKARPPSQRPKHIAPPARNQTHAVSVKRPEETEMDALLARAKELTAVLAKIHPASQRANRTNRTASRNQTTHRNATFDINATFDLSHLVSTKPEQTGMDALLARARELSAIIESPSQRANRTARSGAVTHGRTSLSGQNHSNGSWGNHTETNKLLARVKELSAVLTKVHPGEAVQRKLAGEVKHGLGEHEETDMSALLSRANELTAVLDTTKARFQGELLGAPLAGQGALCCGEEPFAPEAAYEADGPRDE